MTGDSLFPVEWVGLNEEANGGTSALTPALSPRRGRNLRRVWRGRNILALRAAGLEHERRERERRSSKLFKRAWRVSLSSGERAGVRASVPQINRRSGRPLIPPKTAGNKMTKRAAHFSTGWPAFSQPFKPESRFTRLVKLSLSIFTQACALRTPAAQCTR